MKSHGNTLMNKIFNPRNVKPPVPTDIDEADACMERFIRQKYQHRTLEDGRPKPPSRQDSNQGISPEGSPPPLPPKPSKPVGFGLRSASSAADLRRMSVNQGQIGRRESPPPPVPSLGMGASVNTSGNRSFESMMATLRDMGFQNERRNAIVLRELEGNLEKSIETLQRLGEGSNPASRARTPAQPAGATIGASSTGTSSNPFDQLDARPPAQPTNPSYNPFDIPSQPQASQFQQPQAQPLEQSFQNLQVAQPLQPHSTGGYFHQQQQQTPFSQPYYQQSTAPASATLSQGAFVSSPQPTDGGNNPFFQTGAQPQASLATPPVSQNPGLGRTNPFFTQPPSQPAAGSQSTPGFPPPRHANTMPSFSSTTAFGQPSPFQSQAPQSQPSQLQAQPPQQSQPTQQSHNPFQTLTAPATPHSAGYQGPSKYGYQASTQRLAPQATGRLNPANKNNILSLYNFSPTPAMTPENSQIPPSGGFNPATTGTANPYGSYGSVPQMQAQTQQPGTFPSATPQFQTPFSQPSADPQAAGGSRNPFMSSVPGAGAMPAPQQQLQPQQQQTMGLGMSGPPTAGGFSRSHMSQQSVDISGFQNGRHSPDAFASLSARYG